MAALYLVGNVAFMEERISIELKIVQETKQHTQQPNVPIHQIQQQPKDYPNDSRTVQNFPDKNALTGMKG